MLRTPVILAIVGLALGASALDGEYSFSRGPEGSYVKEGDQPDYDWELGVGAYPPVGTEERLVGLAYTTWHRAATWSSVWGTPELGQYLSNNEIVIRQHAAWIADAGVDFIWIDWSNNVNYDPATMHDSRPDFAMIEDSTGLIFDTYADMDDLGEAHPRVSIFLGAPGEPDAITDGRLQAKVDQIYTDYVSNTRYRPLIQDHLDKPLLVIYVGTPSPFQGSPPAFSDSRFTIRWMTGFVTEQHALMNAERESQYGWWSWEDRGPQTFTVYDGRPECMLALASWRSQAEEGDPAYIPARGREGGVTFQEEWDRVRAIGPKFAMVVSWNEWALGEQPSAEISKDLEPSIEHGHFYLNLLKEEIAAFKGIEAAVITSSPGGGWIEEGMRVELTAPGDASTYQWYFGDTLLADGGSISGTQSQVLVFDPVALADAGSYTCVYDTAATDKELVETPAFELVVMSAGSLPVAGLIALGALATLLPAGGVAARRKHD